MGVRARKALVLALTPLLMLAAAEAAVRWSRPSLATLRTPDGRALGSIAEILAVAVAQEPRRHPGTMLEPGLHVRACYDGARGEGFDADGCIDYRLNAYGFRDDEFPLAKPEGELRVLALGDSFTFGAGVHADGTWVQLLERGLAEARGGPVQVINGGFAGGFEPSTYPKWLERDGLLFQPDVVVVALTLNDVSNVHMVYQPGWIEPPAGLHVLSLAERTWRIWWSPEEPAPDWARELREHGKDWRGTQQAVRRMAKLAGDHGARLLVVLFPMLTGLDSGYPLRPLHDAVAEFGRVNGIEVIDLLGAVLGRHDAELWVHPADQHPNSEAHQLFGETLLAALGPSLRTG